MLSEAITTNAIEDETLDRDSVRSSLLHLIGIEAALPNSDEKVAGAAALMVDVREKSRKVAKSALISKTSSLG